MAEASEYVTLVSSDGFSFVIPRSSACISEAVKRMLDPANGFKEALDNTVHFDNMNGILLDKVCEYMCYNKKYRDAKDVPDMDFNTEICLELLVAADYLDI